MSTSGGAAVSRRLAPSEHATVLTRVCRCVSGQPGAALSHEERRAEARAFRPAARRFATLPLPILGAGGRKGPRSTASVQAADGERKSVSIPNLLPPNKDTTHLTPAITYLLPYLQHQSDK